MLPGMFVQRGLPPIVVFVGRPLDSGGAPADDGEVVQSWPSREGVLTLTNTAIGEQPNANDDAYGGAWSLICNNLDHLKTALPAGLNVKWVMFICKRGDRAIISRDTSATTTKPAFQVSVENG